MKFMHSLIFYLICIIFLNQYLKSPTLDSHFQPKYKKDNTPGLILNELQREGHQITIYYLRAKALPENKDELKNSTNLAC